jgi:hypothetical protein
MRAAQLLLLTLAAQAGDNSWQTLDQWLEITGRAFPSQSWTIEDGCLKALANPEGMQDLRTAGTYRSFDLRFEWKIAKGANSGVKYLVQRTDRWQRPGRTGYEARARGLEYQLLDDGANPDAKNGPSRITAALYSIYPPQKHLPVEPEVWHQSRILVDGDHVEHWLDGVKMLEFDLKQPEVAAALRSLRTKNGRQPGLEVLHESPISLQNHGGGVWFRKLQVRRLP